jgi:uncharacterized membrane protein
MKLLGIILRRETVVPVLALSLASTVSVTLVFARIVWTMRLQYGFLIWNLALAWLPLVFALLAQELHAKRRQKSWQFFGLAGLWLLFFPNAPYIFTDLVHLTARFHGHFWVDMTLILICALTGFIVGFVSLYLMQLIVRRMFGGIASWLFIFVVAGLSGVGIYVGRFMRFNSWDVLLRPMKLYQDLGEWMSNPHRTSLAFTVLFATFLFVAYVMLYGLTHLPQPNRLASAEPTKA